MHFVLFFSKYCFSCAIYALIFFRAIAAQCAVVTHIPRTPLLNLHSCVRVLKEPTNIGCKNCHVFCKECLIKYCRETIPKKWGKLICPRCPKNEALVRKWFIKRQGAFQGTYGWQDETCPRFPLKHAALVERQIGNLQVECEKKENGCAWVGCFKDRKRHSQKECEFRKVKCAFQRCPTMVIKKDIQNHLETCKFRPVECSLCS